MEAVWKQQGRTGRILELPADVGETWEPCSEESCRTWSRSGVTAVGSTGAIRHDCRGNHVSFLDLGKNTFSLIR